MTISPSPFPTVTLEQILGPSAQLAGTKLRGWAVAESEGMALLLRSETHDLAEVLVEVEDNTVKLIVRDHLGHNINIAIAYLNNEGGVNYP